METVKNTIEIPRVALADMVLYKNPRKDLKDIKGLAASIVAAGGVTQPMQGFYRELEPGVFKYVVVDGQRRFTSLNLLKEMGEHEELLVNIPFMVLEDNLAEFDILARQIISNEGEPLSPLDLGEAIADMLSGEGDNKLTIADVAAKLGKSKVYIAELKRLADIPEYIKALIRKGTLSATTVREQIKAGTIDAFIAEINERGVEGETIPSEDVTDEIEAEAGKNKITNKTLNKLNSIKEFKNFAKGFSEVFPNKQKQEIYEFASGLINNEFTYEEILEFFTSEETAQFDTAERRALRERADKQTGRNKKTNEGTASAIGGGDTALSGTAEAESTANQGEAENGAEKGLSEENDPLGFLANANEAAGNNIEGSEKEVAAPPKEKKAAAKKAAPAKKVAAKKVAEPKAAAKKTAAPKKAAKTDPSKTTKRKIGYDKSTGKVSE